MRRGRSGRPGGLLLPLGQEVYPLPAHPPVPQTLPPGRPGSARPPANSTATRGRRRAARPGPGGRAGGRTGSQVPRQRGRRGRGTPPRRLRGPRPTRPARGRELPAAPRPRRPRPRPHPPPGERAARVSLSSPPAPRARPPGGGHSPYYRWRRCFGQSLV